MFRRKRRTKKKIVCSTESVTELIEKYKNDIEKSNTDIPFIMIQLLNSIAKKINLFTQLEEDCKTYKTFSDFYFDILQIIIDDEELNNRHYNNRHNESIIPELQQLRNCITQLRIELINKTVNIKYFNIHRYPKNKNEYNIGFISRKEYNEFKNNYLLRLNYPTHSINSTILIEIFSALAYILGHY